MPQLGLGSSLRKIGGVGRTYVKDGLKLYMPYRGDNTTKGTQFVGTGSTSFDGSNDFVNIDTVVGDISSDTAGTITAWVKTDDVSVSDERFIAFGDTDGSSYMQIYNIAGVFRCGYSLPAGAKWDTDTDSTVLTNNTWHHVAVVHNGVEAVLYVDGVAPAQRFVTTADKTLWFAGLTDFDNGRLGCRNYGSGGNTLPMTGSLKNVAIWSRALTATEVQNVMYKTYAEVSGRLASGLVSWWALENSYAGETNLHVKDEAGSNDGTLGAGGMSGVTHPTMANSSANRSLYGGDTPVIPRAIDNAPTVQADAIGAGSASFDGVDDYIDLGSQAGDLRLSGSDGTIATWIKIVDVSADDIYKRIVDKSDNTSANNGYALMIHTDGELYGQIDGSTRVNSAGTVSDNTWTHIAWTWDGTNHKIYIDGVLDVTNAETTQPPSDTTNMKIGTWNHSTAREFKGNICQFGIWSAALTQVQIQSIMEKTYSELIESERTALVSYWTLDEETSTAGVRGGTGGVADSHSTNHGTLV